MAMQADSPAGAPSPQVVGNAFVEQYYQILHQSPESVYRFYQESSVLSRPDTHGVMTSVTTMQGINEKIMSFNYKEYVADIKTADAQQSSGEGVIVLVSGCLTGTDDVKKKFVQSFFLAPQEKGYFVLNDIFRFVEENEPVGSAPGSLGAAVERLSTTPPVSDPVQVPHAPEHQGAVPETRSEDDPNDGAEVCDPSDDDGLVVEDEGVAETSAYPIKHSENIPVDTASSVPEGGAPKKSYASIVKHRKANPTPTQVHPSNNIRAAPSISEQQPHEPSKPYPVPESMASTTETAPESSNVHGEVEGHSIYVRNLPLHATPELLEQEFQKFGPIKQGGIQVRSTKGFCYGFVEFESQSSVTSALEASPVMIVNRKAFIEEKRTTTRGANTNGSGGRGTYSPGGRGGGYRSDGFRGRGGGGGRWYGRGENISRDRRVSERYQRVDKSGAGRGRGGGGHQQNDPQK